MSTGGEVVKGFARTLRHGSEARAAKAAADKASTRAARGVEQAAAKQARDAEKAAKAKATAARREAALEAGGTRAAKAALANAFDTFGPGIKWGIAGAGLATAGAIVAALDDDDPEPVQQWDPPNGRTTHILPASAAGIEGVQKADSDLRATQQELFGFKDGPDGTVWGENPPPPIALAAAVETALTPFTQRSADLASQVQQILQSNEPYVARVRSQLTSPLEAVAKQPGEAAALVGEVKNADGAAAKAYEAFREANRQYRANLVSDGKIGDGATSATLATAVQQNNAAIDAADAKIAGLFPAPAAATVAPTTTGGGNGTPTPKPSTPTPASPTAPAATTPAATPGAGAKPTDTKPTEDKSLKDLLSKLGNSNNPLGGGSPLGSGSGNPLGGGGGMPLSSGSSNPLGGGDKPKLEDSRKDEKKDDKPEKKLEDKSARKPRDLAGAKPLEDVKPEKPADKKPEAAAAAAPVGTPAGPPPAGNPQTNPAAGQGKPQSTEVDVKGTKTTFPDAKTAKLAEVLSAADPTHPVSLADAAQKAGLTPPVPGQDPGKQISPADAKPGNLLVAGEREYLLLEDGKFYDLKDFKVVGADQIPGELGRGGGYFALNDPSPGQPVPGDPNAASAQPGQPGAAQPGQPGQPQGPVSPVSTAGVQQPVPGASGAPVGPVDPAAKPSNDGTGGGGGVPVSGSPGQPAVGKPGDGPGGTAGTATAGGATGPSLGGRSMDPGSVR